MENNLKIRLAEINDTPIILKLIKDLSMYEKLTHQFINNEVLLKKYLFGEKRFAEVLIADFKNQPAGFLCSFITIQHLLENLEFIWKICSFNRKCAVKVLERNCFLDLSKSQKKEIVDESSGAC